jgi:5-methyltetrahydropteroyltriglutamate--homocysteine methyltransferase
MPDPRPPFRAEHIGSLPRPDRLMDARDQRAAGKITADALKNIEDEAIRECVAMQERVGIGAITDGEFRKRGWREFLYDRCDGFGPETVERGFPITMFDGTKLAMVREPVATRKITRREPLSAADYDFLKSITKRPKKANLPTPSVAHFFTGDTILGVYKSREEFIGDLTRVMREEVADLSRRGCTYLQMDEVPLAVICDPQNQADVRKRGDDPDELIDLYIDAINDSIRDRPADMTVMVHMCRGNAGRGMASGGYEPIAERMFNRLKVDGFFLEYDTERAGDFSPLRLLPKPKKAVLGIVSSKLPEIESVDSLHKRIDEAARHVELDRLGISPQCGFASIPSRVRPMGVDVVERKLARVVEAAQKIWG